LPDYYRRHNWKGFQEKNPHKKGKYSYFYVNQTEKG
jgi:hypothetical protein